MLQKIMKIELQPHIDHYHPAAPLTPQHAFSYPISSLNKSRSKATQYHHPSYSPDVPLIPHGVAVSLTAPAVFKFTAPSAPQRHREAAAIFLGKERAHELDRASDEQVGAILGEAVQRFLDGLGVPRGLEGVGYSSADIGKVSGWEGGGFTGLRVRCERVRAGVVETTCVVCIGGNDMPSEFMLDLGWNTMGSLV